MKLFDLSQTAEQKERVTHLPVFEIGHDWYDLRDEYLDIGEKNIRFNIEEVKKKVRISSTCQVYMSHIQASYRDSFAFSHESLTPKAAIYSSFQLDMVI